VLCAQRQESAVREALHEAGCDDPAAMTGNGVPAGWVLFQGVRPTVAVSQVHYIELERNETLLPGQCL
jgi:hypothetical protein